MAFRPFKKEFTVLLQKKICQMKSTSTYHKVVQKEGKKILWKTNHKYPGFWAFFSVSRHENENILSLIQPKVSDACFTLCPKFYMTVWQFSL